MYPVHVHPYYAPSLYKTKYSAEISSCAQTKLLTRCFSVELVLFCQASDLQRQIYRRVLNSPALRSCLATSDPGQHLMCISALKKLCNHPILLHSNTLASVTESDGEQHDLTKVSVRSRDPAPHQHAGERDRERRGDKNTSLCLFVRTEGCIVAAMEVCGFNLRVVR